MKMKKGMFKSWTCAWLQVFAVVPHVSFVAVGGLQPNQNMGRSYAASSLRARRDQEQQEQQEGSVPNTADCDNLPRFNYNSFVVVYFEDEGAVNEESELITVQNAALEAYNGNNNLQEGLCDPLGRQVASVNASFIDTDAIYRLGEQSGLEMNTPTENAVLLELTLACLGCGDSERNAFDSSHLDTENTRRKLQNTPPGCQCPNADEATMYRGQTKEEFRDKLSEILPGMGITSVALDVDEMSSASCPGDDALTDLSDVVLIDFVLDCSLLDADSLFLANRFVEVYNALNKQKYCDPYGRRITSAEVIRRAEFISDDGTLTMELQLNGTCLGCNPSDDGFYYSPVDSFNDANAVNVNAALGTEVSDIEPNSTQANSTAPNIGNAGTRRWLGGATNKLNRQLLTSGDVCFCPVRAVGARAPSEAEVMNAFRGFVEEASQEDGLLKCVASVGQCEFGSTFESSLLVAFSESDNILEFSSDMERVFRDTLNNLFANRIGICRPDFRFVQSVSATIGVQLAEEDQIRHLENIERRTQENDSFEPTARPSTAPIPLTNSPTIAAPAAASPLIPTSSPASRFKNSVLVLLRTVGVCNGCSNDFLIQNQVIGGSRKLEGDESLQSLQRSLANMNMADSNCFCPIESVMQEGNPSVDRVLDLYQDQLEDEDVPLDVRGIREVQVLDCEDEIESFDSQLVLRFSLRLGVSGIDLTRLAELIRGTYNDLTQGRYCDPLMRRIGSMDLASMELLAARQDGCDIFELWFDTFGGCRGCEDESSLFDSEGDEDTRRLNTGNPRPEDDALSHELGRPQRRRRLQGSEVCLCERPTEAERAPTQREFEEILGPLISKEGLEFVCGLVTVTEEPSSLPSSAPSESPTACTVNLENAFESEIILHVRDADQLDVETLTSLGSAVQTAYNELIQDRLRLCDPLYREVTSITLIQEERRGRQLRRGDDVEPSLHRRPRSLQDNELGSPIHYIIMGQCEACGAGSDILDTVPGEDLLVRVKEIVAPILDGELLLGTTEIDKIACSNDLVQFNEVVIVELVPACLEVTFGLGDGLIFALQEAFVSTYNDLASLYCDEHFTELVDAELENVGAITKDGNIPIEIRVFAECLGCDPEEAGIYGTPSPINRVDSSVVAGNNGRLLKMPVYTTANSLDGGGRLLEDAVCLCNAQALANRPPSESEIIDSYRDKVEALMLDCVASVGECQFGFTFDTDIVLSLTGNQTDIVLSFEGNQTNATEDVGALIEESFLSLLNEFYQPTEDVCNPEFRVITDVTVVFDFTLNGEFIDIGTNSASGVPAERLLQSGDLQRRDHEATSAPVFVPIGSPTQSSSPVGPPTTVAGIDDGGLTSSLHPSPPTSTPTTLFTVASDQIRTLLTISGVCNGCTNDLFLSNQVLGGRGLGVSRDDGYELDSLINRGLQGEQSKSISNCFCPLTAIVNPFPLTREEIQRALTARLADEKIELEVTNVDTVSAIPCDDETETTEFTSEFTFAFSAIGTISDVEIQQLGDTIASVYNTLVEDYCDPLIRREIALEVVDRRRVIASGSQTSGRRDLQEGQTDRFVDEDTQANCVNFEATFAVTGLCRGCDEGTPLLDSGSISRSLEVHHRILSSGQRTQRTRRRHLLSDREECFCDSSTIAPRAPTLEELWLRLELELGTFVDVCGRPVECDPANLVSQFSETTILALLLQRGTVLSEENLLELEVTYLNAYNAMQNNLRADKCGGNFRQLDSITTDRTILGDRRNLETTEEATVEYRSNGRRLSVQSLFYVGSGKCPRPCEEVITDLDVLTAMIDSIESVSFVEEVIAVNEYITGAPSSNPSVSPSAAPSSSPSSSPSSYPSSTPSISPSTTPSTSPSTSPSQTPSTSPSTSPSESPTISAIPSGTPSGRPSRSDSPSTEPSESPNVAQSSSPSKRPTRSIIPSHFPSTTGSPSSSSVPSVLPSGNPTQSTSPSAIPSRTPSSSSVPSADPTDSPSGSKSPSRLPSHGPSSSSVPSVTPSQGPSRSANPSGSPSKSPSPSSKPSGVPSQTPSVSASPSAIPSKTPSSSSMPSVVPSEGPSGSTSPSRLPSKRPSSSSVPSVAPSPGPSLSANPSGSPSKSPSPSSKPSGVPSQTPSVSASPSAIPSKTPSSSSIPSVVPSASPSGSLRPSRIPTKHPSSSSAPSDATSQSPSISSNPSGSPSQSPSPSSKPSGVPSTTPSISANPSVVPSKTPSSSLIPSTDPSDSPSGSTSPSGIPSERPSSSSVPSVAPSYSPSLSTNPSGSPSLSPSSKPSDVVSTSPSSIPSKSPSSSSAPSAVPSNTPSGSTRPSGLPSKRPSSSSTPSVGPSHSPSLSTNPSGSPSNIPSTSLIPSLVPSTRPSVSINPSSLPSKGPSFSSKPSVVPSDNPSGSISPSGMPAKRPSTSPVPSVAPSTSPSLSINPSRRPTQTPTQTPTPVPTVTPFVCTPSSLSCIKCKPLAPTTNCCFKGNPTTCGASGFRLLKNINGFDASPDRRDIIEHFLANQESDPDAHFTQAEHLLPPDALNRAASFVEEQFRAKESITDQDHEAFQLVVDAKTIVELLGIENVRQILKLLSVHMGKEEQPVTGIFFQRFEHDGSMVSPYHTDGEAISLVVLLNDDFEGGEMTYLTRDGATVIDSVAGAATVHGPGVVHGNAAVKGIKHQLTFLSHPNAKSDCMFAGLLHE